MSEFDLTFKLAPFLDVHLIMPLLEFLEPRKLFDDKSIREAQRAILSQTNYIDNLIETYPADQVPPELVQKREMIAKEREELKAKVNPILAILEQDAVKENLAKVLKPEEFTSFLENLQTNYNFTPDMLDTLYKYAKLQYECGDYMSSSVLLQYYRQLVPQHDLKNYLNALYGKLASEIMLMEWDHARDDLLKLRVYIDANPFDTEAELIHHRAWLLHWSLFVYFNSANGRNEIVDLFFHNYNYLNTIQILCPHLLRYLVVAVMTGKIKQPNIIKKLVSVIKMVRHSYHDPVTDFLTCLYVNFDFDSAQEKLKLCEEVLTNDFFLTACLSDFRESARLLVFDMFCRIHQSVSIEALAKRLNMTESDAERWIVDLIRINRIEGAKIDSIHGVVAMASHTNNQSVHEKVLENTKSMVNRVEQLAFQLNDTKFRDTKLRPTHR
ncbi:hypothetical protein WR25_12952 [Diploscapter pachys]|uniref:Eukaryotic translation initiation factor 3 subunit E n=1 Tax=Diploscapter pachys TaxID=2018661 RepID=A0A2A2K340_9BILA|nr:hypothetical protein WR25_12952 [Diploscapter pachys]